MKEHPILFSAQMVQAILEGRKTQTRRVAKISTPFEGEISSICQVGAGLFSIMHGKRPVGDEVQQSIYNATGQAYKCPYGKPGDRLWVKETFQTGDFAQNEPLGHVYRATDPDWGATEGWRWKPSIFMPRKASRITLEITDIRCERLNDISEGDAVAEGVWQEYLDEKRDYKRCPQCGGTGLFDHHSLAGCSPDCDCLQCDTSGKRFKHLFNSINGSESWKANPYVWVISFKRIN